MWGWVSIAVSGVSAVHDYVTLHWHELGGEHFIAMCTAFNTALVSWTQFQNTIRHAENKLDEKLMSVSASLADSDRSNHLKTLAEIVLKPLRWLHEWGWRIIFGLAVIGTISGMVMLYARLSCPFDFFLLLPTVAHLLWSWITLAILSAWVSVMKRGIEIFGPPFPDHEHVENAIDTFARNTEAQLGKGHAGLPAPPRPPSPPPPKLQ